MKRVALLLAVAVIAVLVAVPAVQAQGNGPVPPWSNAYGKSLTEWMVLYNTWFLGGDQEDHVGHVRFLPIPGGEYESGAGTVDDPAVYVGHLDASLGTGEPFVLPVAMWIGETYDPDLGYPDDTPLDPSVFTDSNVLITLDGKPIIDSAVDDLSDYYFGPADFEDTIYYDSPTDYGSIGAIWVQGIGFVHQPLSKGSHTLTLHSEIIIPDFDLGVAFDNSWDITVGK